VDAKGLQVYQQIFLVYQETSPMDAESLSKFFQNSEDKKEVINVFTNHCIVKIAVSLSSNFETADDYC
jgi:hypothetical protein